MNPQTVTTGRAFYVGLLEVLTRIMGMAQGYLRHHGRRTGQIARLVAERQGLSRKDVGEVLFASVLADMGMIGLVEDAWENPMATLDATTRARVRLHPLRSEEAVRSIPHLQGVAPLVRHHHEWWDGGGYPDGLRGKLIPEGARVLRLADTVAALGEIRPQRPALGHDRIRSIVREAAGREFGPREAETWLSLTAEGPLQDPEPAAFHRTLIKAAEHLLPAELSPLSSEHLLEILATLIDAKDPYTAGHSRRVAILAVALANRLRLPPDVKDTVWAGGFLHDLGKLSVPLRILTRDGPLDEEEREAVALHTHLGAGVLEEIPSLRHLTTGVRYHHERWDGRGYPEGLKGDHIPLVAQILAVCDAYDAMTSGRAYRPSMAHDEALEEIAQGAGLHFGPRVAASFLSLPEALFDAVRRAGRQGRVRWIGPSGFRRPARRDVRGGPPRPSFPAATFPR